MTRGSNAPALSNYYIPHFFIGDDGTETKIRFLNVENTESTITLKAFSDSSDLVHEKQIDLQPRTLTVIDVRTFLINVAAPETGYFQVTSRATEQGILPHLAGDVEYKGGHGKSFSRLPLLKHPSEDIVFSQVAHSSAMRVFTGLALLNPQTDPATVSIQAYTSTGELTAQKELTVAPGEKIVDVLGSDSYFGPAFQQVRGHLHILSDQPLFAYALFGSLDREFLSAVEGQ